MTVNNKTLSVVTATLNADNHIGKLINCLENQTDKNFSFVVFDGGSTDRTVEIISSCNLKDVILLEGRDFGIYDALNRCLAALKTEYYIVCGADDLLTESAIENYKKSAAISNADIVCSLVKIGDSIIYPRKNSGFLYGMGGISSSHSVGVAIRTELHQVFGFYSKKLPIAADQLFIKSVYAGGCKFYYADFLSGEFSLSGTSGKDMAGVLTESFRVQLATEKFKCLQLFIFILRLVKNYNRL